MTLQERIGKTLDFLRGRKHAYQLVFGNRAGDRVLEDLAKFCRATESCAVLDANGRLDEKMTFVLIGRNEVFQRINQHMNLSSADLYTLYKGPQLNQEQDNG